MKIPTDDKAILKGREVVPVYDLMEWGRAFESGNRRVAEDYIGNVHISTVFLGMDHGFGGEPLWFETMVFGGKHDGYQERYSTYEEAEAGHKRIVEMVSRSPLTSALAKLKKIFSKNSES